MKATRQPDGTWSFEDVSITELRELMSEVHNGSVSLDSTVEMREPKKRGRPPEHEEVVELNPTQLQTLQYLQAHDSEDGTTAKEMARGMDLSVQAVYARLHVLNEMNLVYRLSAPSRGWRPGEGE